jgi:hypothetical protein
MRKSALAVAATIVTGLSAAAVALPAQAATTATATCSTHWGTGPRHKDQMVQTKVRGVRAGQHTCFDRLVIDLGAGRAPGYDVRYVRAFHADGSGKLVRTSGKAKLLVVVQAPAASAFNASSRHLVSVTGFASFRQVAGLGSFEGITSLGIGVKAKTPFRVFEYKNAAHKFVLVIDVAHR